LSTGDLDPVKLKLLAEHRNSTIRNAGQTNCWLISQLGRRSDVMESYRGVLEVKGDAERGKQIFTQTCAACPQSAKHRQ